MSMREDGRAAIPPAVIGGTMGLAASFLMNYLVMPFPEGVLENALNNGISGGISGFMGGFMGLVMHFKQSRKA